MKGCIIHAVNETPGCSFEYWDKERRAMRTCNNTSVATIGNAHVCLEHLPHVLLCTPNLDLYDAPRPGKKAGESVFCKEDFLRIAKGL